MSFLKTLLHNPRKLWLRRATFQIHLWAGVLLSLYIVIVALTGSILVFRRELTRAQLPSVLSPYDAHRVAPIRDIVEHFVTAYPGAKIQNLQMPSSEIPAYIISAHDAQHRALRIAADPVTGKLWQQPRTWLDTTYDLHVYLLLGQAHGMQINGIGAAVLLLLTLSGLLLWWPGIKGWARGLRIDFTRNWRRINFDGHSAIGFWTLLIAFWWALSGIYFAWYRQVTDVVASISPLHGMVSPKLPPLPPPDSHRTSLDHVLSAIQRTSPNGHLFSLSDPMLSDETVYALVDLRKPGDFSHRDIIALSSADGRVLTVWHYGQNQSAGDWILWAMHPLHFGTLWGIMFEILWALCGIALAALAITGLFMYWNRFLRHQFRS